MHKDIRLALETGGELDVPLPSAHAADDVLTKASELGYEHRDIAALHDSSRSSRIGPMLGDGPARGRVGPWSAAASGGCAGAHAAGTLGPGWR